MQVKSGGMIVGAEFVNGQLIGGVTYTSEELAQRARDKQAMRIEAKLDALIKHFGIEFSPDQDDLKWLTSN